MAPELLTQQPEVSFPAPEASALGEIATSGTVEFTRAQQVEQSEATHSLQANPSVVSGTIQQEATSVSVQPILERFQPTIGERVHHIAKNLGRMGLLTAELFMGAEILGWFLKEKPKSTEHHTFMAA